MNSKPGVQVENLGRIYKVRDAKKSEAKQLVALENVNLTIHQGELFGLLGPNGAGKTTLIKILTTLLSPTSGKALVAGLDVETQFAEVRKRINMVSGGEYSGYGLLTVRENLWMFAQFYGIPSKEAYQRIDTMLKVVGLADRANTRSADLSTGLRQKMNIVRGFLTDPEILFLDEPTLGLDVSAARDVRAFVKEWLRTDTHRTLLLTTHYMAEADELCDRIAIINRGKVLACDTPQHLKQLIQHDAIFSLDIEGAESVNEESMKSLPGVNAFHQKLQDGYSNIELILAEESALANVISAFTAQGARIRSLQKREPTLEDVFMNLVGQRMEDVENANLSTSQA